MAEVMSASAVTYADIPKLPRIPLWPRHLYRGTVTMAAGEGGSGKGLIGVHAAAVVTRGGYWPGEVPDSDAPIRACDRMPGSVIGVWPEDDPNEDLAYRLPAALSGVGADLRHVYDMTETEDGEPFDLSAGGEASIGRLRAQIDGLAGCNGELPCGCGTEHEEPRWPVLLVIIDPLLAVAETVSTNKAARRTLRPLMKLAKDTGVAVYLTHHTVKDGKIASSKGLTDVLRLVFRVIHDPATDGVMMMTVDKSNNLGPIGDLRYRIAGTEQEPYLEWIESAKATKQPQEWRGRLAPAATRPVPSQPAAQGQRSASEIFQSLGKPF